MRKARLVATAIAIAAPVVIVCVAGVVIVKKLRERKEDSIVPASSKRPIEELLLLKGEDFVPNDMDSSLYQRKLASMSDRDLIVLYALLKVGEVLKNRGVSVHTASKEDRHAALQEFRTALSSKSGRSALLSELGSIGFEVLISMLQDGLYLTTASKA